jgi:hypothetical protein
MGVDSKNCATCHAADGFTNDMEMLHQLIDSKSFRSAIPLKADGLGVGLAIDSPR